jgi:NADP-dependent 3-hydroxy acid dehydrogenase YdfG
MFGPLIAAKLVGEIAGAQRFATPAELAPATGVAPILDPEQVRGGRAVLQAAHRHGVDLGLDAGARSAQLDAAGQPPTHRADTLVGTPHPVQLAGPQQLRQRSRVEAIALGAGLADPVSVGETTINNAGLMPLSPLELERFDEWDQAIDVNIKGVLWGIAAALPHFKEQKSGQFINVSSVAGHTISPGGAIYSATKYSVRVISEALRQEVKPYSIRTTVISPGAVDTELPSSVKAEGVAGPIADYYEQNAIPADSFARCVLFAIGQPDDVDVSEILFRPTKQQL